MKLLGITGVVGSGKTTLSGLTSKYGWARYRFATPIKSMIFELLVLQEVDEYVAERMVDGDLKEIPTQFLNGRSPRHAMQTLGTEWRNMIHRDLWIDIFRRSIFNSSDEKIIVDDLRFKNEAIAIRDLGGKIIKIERPNNTTGTPTTHISETEMAEIVPDIVITNDAAPKKMLRQLKDFLGEL